MRRERSIRPGDAAKSQGWTSLIVKTNGNGKRDEYTERGQPLDPNKDMRIGQTIYAVMPDPKDGSIWGSLWGIPGGVVRINPGSNLPPSGDGPLLTRPYPPSGDCTFNAGFERWFGQHPVDYGDEYCCYGFRRRVCEPALLHSGERASLL